MNIFEETTFRLEEIRRKIAETTEFLRSRGVTDPEVGIVLGTGLNNYADSVEDAIVIPYNDIPNMQAGKVDSHRGQLIYGRHMGKNVLIMAGRLHFYETNSMETTAFPARVMVAMGIKRMIITNAAGGINPAFDAGCLMLISDHINMSGTNPLIGKNLDEYGTRFPDMTYTYNRELRAELKARAADEGIRLFEGVYLMATGPSFETPAEIRAFGIMGADAVGMSSVPEAIIASHARLEVIGISAIANKAAGLVDKPLTNDDVTEASKKIEKDFMKVVDLAIEI
jgi:purine-nucleoside phosphorylase